MAYAQIHTVALRHPKVLRISDTAFRLWVAGLAHCQEHLTDGAVDAAALWTFGVRHEPSHVAELIDAGLWHRDGDNYEVHDYLDWNESRVIVLGRRSKAKDRVRARREAVRANTSANTSANTPANNTPNDREICLRIGSYREQVQQEDQKEKRTASDKPLADDLLHAWVTVAHQHGVDVRVSPTRGEVDHLIDLADAYSLDEFTRLATAWWGSPYVTASRNIGLFRTHAAQVQAHLASGSTAPFLAPVKPLNDVSRDFQLAAIKAAGPPAKFGTGRV